MDIFVSGQKFINFHMQTKYTNYDMFRLRVAGTGSGIFSAAKNFSYILKAVCAAYIYAPSRLC